MRHGDAAIGEPDGAGDVARFVGRKEGVDVGDFLRRPAPSKRCRFDVVSSVFLSMIPVSWCVHAVSIGPGLTQFARIPCAACSNATPFMKAWRKTLCHHRAWPSACH